MFLLGHLRFYTPLDMQEMVSWRIRGVNLLLEVLLTIEDPLSVLTKDCISDGIHDSALVQFAQILRTRLTSLDTCSSATQVELYPSSTTCRETCFLD